MDAQKKPSLRKELTLEMPAIMQDSIEQLKEYFEGVRLQFDLDIMHIGTDFQKMVWTELLNIPYGTTISYLELSRRIGNEKSIRAVGQTNGKNQISIIVPCHRVIGSDGKLVGYGGDLWRKKWLLQHKLQYALKQDGLLF